MADKTYARTVEAKAVETIRLAEPLTLAECFHEDVAALFRECPADTIVGATVDAQGAWANPPAPVAPPPAPVLLAQLTPMQFYLAFTPAERIAIKGSADAEVKEFWATYELAAQLNHAIDPNLVSVTAGLAYLRSAGILAADVRVDQIKAGVAQ